MEGTARLRYTRISPRKVSIVAKLIRGKSVKHARAILRNTPKAASELLLKTLNSAVANAENVYEQDSSGLVVTEVSVGAGSTLKRIHPRARGSAARILKRTSHITVSVSDLAEYIDDGEEDGEE